jgi:hypothetical protein
VDICKFKNASSGDGSPIYVTKDKIATVQPYIEQSSLLTLVCGAKVYVTMPADRVASPLSQRGHFEDMTV